MKILVSVEDLGITGVAAVAIENAAALRARGHEVSLFAAPGLLAHRAVAFGLEIVGEPGASLRPTWRGAWRLRRLAASLDVDIVHAYALRPCLEAFYGAHLVDGVPLVTSLLHNPTRTTPAYLPRTVPLVVGRESIVADLKARGARSVRAVRPAVSPDKRPSEADTAAFRAEHGLVPEHHVVLAVSRLEMEPELLRGVETAVDAIGLLAERDETVRLVIVGDGSERWRIEERARAVNARTGRETVQIVGVLSDLAPAFAACDLVVAVATSALRAMAFGRATVVAGSDGQIELPDADALARYRTAGVFARGTGTPDVEAISQMLGGLLDDPSRTYELAERERAETAEHWSAPAAAAALEIVYADAIASGPRRAAVVRDAMRSGWRYGLSRTSSAAVRLRNRSS